MFKYFKSPELFLIQAQTEHVGQATCSTRDLCQVQVDEASLEVQEINIILNTNHWKKSPLCSAEKTGMF